MKYDFRHNYPASRDELPNGIPLKKRAYCPWVADMDFRTAPAVIEALQRRVAHGIFGYTKVPQAYYDAVVRWFGNRHRWQVDPPVDRLYERRRSGVVGDHQSPDGSGRQGDRQTPAYNCFYSSIRNDGCEMSANRLVYRDNRYTVDFDDLEAKAADPKAKLLLLCNPHNPVGRVWTPEEPAAYRRHLPAARGIRGCGRDPLRTDLRRA